MLAEQQSAVLAAKLEAATARADKVEADASECRELVRSFTAATGTATAEQAQL